MLPERGGAGSDLPTAGTHVPLPTLLIVTDTLRLTASLRAKVRSDISSKATLRMLC